MKTKCEELKKAKENVKKILSGLASNADIPPILVRKYKGGYQVLDGHHRFWAYKVAKKDSIPARIVPDKDIEEVGKESVSEANNLSVQQLAQISDAALDAAYHYGRSTPGNNFGWLANLKSAGAAQRMIASGITDIEKI